MTTPPIPPEAMLEPAIVFEPPPLPRETPRAMDLLVMAAILFVSGILVFIAGAVAMATWGYYFHIVPNNMSKAQTFAFAIPLQALWYLLAVAIAVPVYRYRWQRSFADGVHWNAIAAQSRAWMLLGSGLLLSVLVQVASVRIHMPSTAPVYELFRFPALAWGVTVFGVFIAPAAEELFFRGFLLPILARGTGNVVAIIITSALFALLHASQIGHAWMAVLVLGCVSVVLCIVRIKYNSVAASTLVHMAYNGLLFVMMILATGGYRHLDKIPH
jgi:membrane protease YdiL (CAAX protease family)